MKKSTTCDIIKRRFSAPSDYTIIGHLDGIDIYHHKHMVLAFDQFGYHGGIYTKSIRDGTYYKYGGFWKRMGDVYLEYLNIKDLSVSPNSR